MNAFWSISTRESFDGFSVSRVRPQLKHSWLENQVQNKDADDIVMLWQAQLWQEVLESNFPDRIQKTTALAENLVIGFSPSQLVDELSPLSSLPDPQKERLRATLHEIYLARCPIESLAQQLHDAAKALEGTLAKLRECWKLPPSAKAEQKVRASWQDFRKDAERLYKILEKVPKGVVIP